MSGASSGNNSVFDDQLVGLDDIVHIQDYFELRNIDLALFTPDDNAATAIPTPKPEPNGPSRAQCARRDHEEYLIYLPCARDGELSGSRTGGTKQQKSRGACTVDARKTPGVRVDLRAAAGIVSDRMVSRSRRDLAPGAADRRWRFSDS